MKRSLVLLTLMLSCITSQMAAMDISEIKPISTMEWLFGYRSYTSQEQQIVDILVQLEQYNESSITKWFYANDQRTKIAELFVKFIEAKSLETTFPKIYKIARFIEDEATHALLTSYLRTKGNFPNRLSPASKTNIEKGLAPGISFKN